MPRHMAVSDFSDGGGQGDMDAKPAPLPRAAWLRVAGCSAAKLAVSLAVSEAFVLVPLECERLGVPLATSMAVLAAQPLVYIIASPVIGRLLDRARPSSGDSRSPARRRRVDPGDIWVL